MRKRKPSRADRPRKRKRTGRQARAGRQTLRSEKIGALPILNHFLQRLRLEEFLQEHLPPEDHRMKLPPAKALLVLLRNLLVSREPLYGIGEWAAGYAPDLLGLTRDELEALNDDRVGRAWTGCSAANRRPSCWPWSGTRPPSSTSAPTSCTTTRPRSPSTAPTPTPPKKAPAADGATLAITLGHNKDHRPDLKQLLYILTVTDDGGVPLHFRAASGNVTDDQTHRDTWDLLCQLTGRRDFLYVADCKLATAENMAYLHQHGGRFVTVLPRTRGEDAAFRESLREGPGRLAAALGEDRRARAKKVLDRFSRQPTNRPSPPKAIGCSGITARARPNWTPWPAAAGSQRAIEATGRTAGEARLAADPLPPAGQGGRGGGGDPRARARPTSGSPSTIQEQIEETLSPGATRPAGQGHPLREEGGHAVRPDAITSTTPGSPRTSRRRHLPAGHQRRWSFRSWSCCWPTSGSRRSRSGSRS